MTGIRVGCVYRPQVAPEHIVAAARAAEDAGLDEMWLWEDCFLAGGISAAAIALAGTSHVTIGVGVLPAPLRNVALTAMEIATLCRAYPGRVRIGIGHGVQEWMAQIGEKVASPMTLLREYLTALRALLDGERVTVDGTYVTLDAVQLEWPPEYVVELLCAAEGPRTLRLSGELASGTVLGSGTSPQVVRDAVGHIGAGQALRSTVAPHSVVTYLICALGADSKQVAGDEIRSWGLAPDSDVAVYGSPAEVAAAAQRWIDAGTDTIVFQPGVDTDITAYVTAIATEVQPLLRRGRP